MARKIQHEGVINGLQLLIGLGGLFLGTLVYLIDRPPEATYFMHFSRVKVSLYGILPNVFGVIGNSLPDFLHVFSFILLTAGLLSWGKRGSLVICLGWLFIDFIFELFQKFNALPLRIIPEWFRGIPFLENTQNYFRHGTFDLLDLIAISLGTVTAYFVVLGTNKGDEKFAATA
ncbi:MAG: hypothetical protein JRF35_08580 [Deltaproteobacteria bacterium]|nr:hypothetical protein [Deltaproteobacteria bacterium]